MLALIEENHIRRINSAMGFEISPEQASYLMFGNKEMFKSGYRRNGKTTILLIEYLLTHEVIEFGMSDRKNCDLIYKKWFFEEVGIIREKLKNEGFEVSKMIKFRKVLRN